MGHIPLTGAAQGIVAGDDDDIAAIRRMAGPVTPQALDSGSLRGAVDPAGRVLGVEPVGDMRAGSEFDLAMLVMYGGRERRVDEFRTLAAPQGRILDTVLELTDQRCLLVFRPCAAMP